MFPEGTPTTVVSLGGKDRTLGFTIGAMRRIKEAGGSLTISEGEDSADFIYAVPLWVWACMDKEDREELSVEDVEDRMHPGNMEEISAAVTQLFLSSRPEGAEGNAPKAPKGRRQNRT
jgi:hypothetical protein